MKTLDEACLATFCRQQTMKPGEDDEAAGRKLFEEICADSERWTTLAADVNCNELVENYLLTVIAMIAKGKMDLRSALASCFIQGTIVGIVMERQPELSAESVPGRRERAPGSSPREPPPTGWTSI